jgi:hypothetical protein
LGTITSGSTFDSSPSSPARDDGRSFGESAPDLDCQSCIRLPSVPPGDMGESGPKVRPATGLPVAPEILLVLILLRDGDRVSSKFVPGGILRCLGAFSLAPPALEGLRLKRPENDLLLEAPPLRRALPGLPSRALDDAPKAAVLGCLRLNVDRGLLSVVDGASSLAAVVARIVRNGSASPVAAPPAGVPGVLIATCSSCWSRRKRRLSVKSDVSEPSRVAGRVQKV